MENEIVHCPNCNRHIITLPEITCTVTRIRCRGCNHIHAYSTPNLVMTNDLIKEVTHETRPSNKRTSSR